MEALLWLIKRVYFFLTHPVHFTFYKLTESDYFNAELISCKCWIQNCVLTNVDSIKLVPYISLRKFRVQRIIGFEGISKEKDEESMLFDLKSPIKQQVTLIAYTWRCVVHQAIATYF